ncbi:GYD domain-containing protein [Halomarina litorea]|uniref:GYD domain-containing protein n=1 Tax=Halomarina litorea TaxID=2961595 RepID=UPI0020C4FE17|nr:GYD domain-containing protein [Halomarina sp. BCD28]
MSTYLMFADWTEQGFAALDESPNRLDDASDLAESLGGTLREFFMTMGPHDMAAVVEMPDDAAMARFALTLSKGGSVTTETVQAYTEAEYREILGGMD